MSWTEKIYSVSELTREIKDLLEEEFPFIWVEGEISNFRVPPSGHYYFVLKDAASQLRAVFFRSGQGSLNFIPEDGLQVLCQGRVSVYAGRGEYQIILERMELKGWGALQLAFERLKEKLQKEGLFDPGRKRPLPVLPRRVAVVTSPTGAAVRDFLRVLYRRFHNIQTYVVPVLVQGEKASSEIAEALGNLNRSDLGIEVIVLTRGGGSIEDLWAFNEERVARAIAASAIPVVSAVGHEVDFTMADFVADVRASTPSAAAEILIRPQREWEEALEDLKTRFQAGMNQQLVWTREQLNHQRHRLGDPRRRWEEKSLRLDDQASRLRLALQGSVRSAGDRLRWAGEVLQRLNPRGREAFLRARLETQRLHLNTWMTRSVHDREQELKRLGGRLGDLNPLAVLSRGYALARRLPGLEIIKQAGALQPGQPLRIQVARGALDCRVETVIPEEETTLGQREI